MAGPSIAVRVIGDTSALGASFDDTSSKASAAGQRIHDAFGSVLNTLNSTGVLGPFGTALATVNDGIGQIIDSAKKIGPVLLAAGGTIAAVGGSLTALGSKDQAAQQQLQAAISATGATMASTANPSDRGRQEKRKLWRHRRRDERRTSDADASDRRPNGGVGGARRDDGPSSIEA